MYSCLSARRCLARVWICIVRLSACRERCAAARSDAMTVFCSLHMSFTTCYRYDTSIVLCLVFRMHSPSVFSQIFIPSLHIHRHLSFLSSWLHAHSSQNPSLCISAAGLCCVTLWQGRPEKPLQPSIVCLSTIHVQKIADPTDCIIASWRARDDYLTLPLVTHLFF